MRRYAFFPGCKIPYFLDQYGTSCRRVLKALDVPVMDVEFNCCGYPIRTISFEAFILSAARNIAKAEKLGADILTPCKCCFGTLTHADHWLRCDDGVRRAINGVLRREGLEWQGTVEIVHVLQVFAKEIGVERLRTYVTRPCEGLRIALHYGCHALRPGNVARFDNPLAPTLFEELVAVTGATPVEWSKRLECCGHPLWEKNNSLSQAIMETKLSDARRAGADCMCTACTYCQIQFDAVQEGLWRQAQGDGTPMLPSILYTQLLGWTMGIEEKALGLRKNKVDTRGILLRYTT